jgi:hypothetical protein
VTTKKSSREKSQPSGQPKENLVVLSTIGAKATTIKHAAQESKKNKYSESRYCRGRAGVSLPLVYDSYVIVRKKTELDTQPQTTTQPTTLSSP